MPFTDNIQNPPAVVGDADSYELQQVLARARLIMTPEQAKRLDDRLKKLVDRLSTEDGAPHPYVPWVP